MPFPKDATRLFTEEFVKQLEQGQKGCYGLRKGSTWVYVGKGDIRQRLLDHLGKDNACIVKQAPNNFVFVVTDEMDQMEKELIIEYNPICNERVG